VLALSGLLGFFIGAVRLPSWHVAVETAQVVAGLVEYPRNNPFYIYHTKLWTILHQICAVFLRLGVSEITLSTILSGVLGMLSFQALSLFVWALCGSAVLAIGSPFLIVYSRVAQHGVSYPIDLVGIAETYGGVGLSYFALVAALFGAGFNGAAAFLLGLAPCVHPSLGAWLWMAVLLAGLSDLEQSKALWASGRKYFIAAAGITIVSLIVQLTVTYDVPRTDPAEVSRYLNAFLSLWDTHRRSIDPYAPGVAFNAATLVLGLIWIRAGDLTRPAQFLLRISVASATICFLFAAIFSVAPASIPTTLLVLMPSRLLNFNVMTFGALLIGLLGLFARVRPSPWVEGLLLVLLAGLLFGSESMLWQSPHQSSWAWMQGHLNTMVTLTMASIAVFYAGLALWKMPPRPAAVQGPLTRSLALVCLSTLVLSAWMTTGLSRSRAEMFRDRTNDPFFRWVAADHHGLLATAGSYHLVQLYTRRPVLIDGGGLDGLVYAPEGAPMAARILKDVYDIDYFDPPVETRGRGTISHGVTRAAWEGFSKERWEQIRHDYNVTQVLTPADWVLNLPIIVQDEHFRLYNTQ
jgi:hypothetical protein